MGLLDRLRVIQSYFNAVYNETPQVCIQVEYQYHHLAP